MSKTRKVPVDALRFRGGMNAVAIETDSNAPQQFRMVANSGQPMTGHWYWGTLAVDLAGLNVSSQSKPVLRDHDTGQVVGVTDTIEVTNEGLAVTGRFTEATEAGREAAALAADGFPWEASIFAPPSRLEEIEEGRSAEVNGYQLAGPATIFREAELNEVSFTVFGADRRTRAEAMSDSGQTVDVPASGGDMDNNEMNTELEAGAVEETVESAELEATASEPQVDTDQHDEAGAEQFSAEADVAAALSAERARVADIIAAKFEGQDAMVAKFVAAGTPAVEAISELRAAELSRLRADQATPSASEDASVAEPTDAFGKWRSDFDKSAELQAEFGSADAYALFMAEEEGRA